MEYYGIICTAIIIQCHSDLKSTIRCLFCSRIIWIDCDHQVVDDCLGVNGVNSQRARSRLSDLLDIHGGRDTLCFLHKSNEGRSLHATTPTDTNIPQVVAQFTCWSHVLTENQVSM